MARFAARLHVLLASAAPVGLVIRRGPSKSVATILWNRKTDSFELGQWMRGRIFERRSDLSPDGKHFLYFALNGKWKSETHGSWTAISRAPYLKAVTLYAKGNGWYGGGLWTGPKQYWLNDDDSGHRQLHSDSDLKRNTKFNPVCYGGECPGVYYPRLIRDGWTHRESLQLGKLKSVEIFDKPANHRWTIRKLAHAEIGAPPGKGCYWDEHQLVNAQTNDTLACPDWEWADIDGQRLVWATHGRLETVRLATEGLADQRVLHDFNNLEFTEIKAPY